MSLRQKVASYTPAEPARSDGRCAAHGCPIPGSIADTPRPGNETQWVCRFHFREKADNWQRITEWTRSLSSEERMTSMSIPRAVRNRLQ